MDSLLNLFPLYTDSSERDLKLSQYLETCRVHQSLAVQENSPSQTNHVLSILNSKLNNQDTRIEGTLLLNIVVAQCGTEIFTSNCLSWTQQVVKILQGPTKLEGGASAFTTLCKLIELSSQFSDLYRQLSTSVVCQLVTLLCDPEFQKKDQLLERSLDCLKCCMKYYPSTCGQVKVSIEKHLLSLVDSGSLQPESSIQASWAYCMSLLPGLGGSGPQGLQYKTNWIQFCTQLIQSLHSSMSMLFKNIEEIKTYEVPADSVLKLADLQHKNPMVLLHAEKHRFINLSAALSRLLKVPFTASKNVPVNTVLQLVSRVLTLNTKTLTKCAHANFEQVTLASIMPDLHMATMNVVTALIGAAKVPLLGRASDVMNLFVRVLQWTSTEGRSLATERPYGKLRSRTYESLLFWLSASRSACGLTKYVDILLSQVLSDVVVQRDTVHLQSGNQVTLPPSSGKKAKKRALDSSGIIQHKADLQANCDVCLHALRCLSSLMLHCGPRIKPAIHKEVQESTLSVLADLKNGPQPETLQPYNDPRCRAALYKLLERLVLCSSPHWPAPLYYANAIFHSGLEDSSLEVSSVCSEALVAIDPLMRPRGPTLNFPMECGPIRTAFQEPKLMGGRPAVESAAPIVSKEVLAVMELEMVDIRAPETSPLIQHNFDIIAPAALRPPPPLVSAQLEVKDSPAVGWKLAEAPEPPPVTSPKPPVEQVAQPTAAAKVRTPKRPSAEPVQYPAQSKKIVNELAYGPDAQDDDLDSMLASFRDVPAD